jgi:hypothetical protein
MLNRSKSALGSAPLGPINGNGVRDAEAHDALTLMASTPLLRPRNDLSYESVVIRACGGSECHAPLMSYMELESRLAGSCSDKVSAKALAEMENVFCSSAREVVLHLSMMAPERARLTERMFSFYASLFPRLLPSITSLEEQASRLRSIVDRETEQRTRVGKLMTEWCASSSAGSTEQRLRKGLLKALASCDEGKEDKGARGSWAPMTEYLFRQSQALVKELDFTTAELAAAIPPAKLQAAQQAHSDVETRLKDAEAKLLEEQKSHAETRRHSMLRLSEMTEELNSKIRDASEEVYCCCCHSTRHHVTCCLQAARCRSHHEAQSCERESLAQQKIDELSQQLSAAKQSSEVQLADAASLRTKLLSAEAQLAEHAQSEPRALPLGAFIPQPRFAEMRSSESQHQETMLSTQTALLEAQGQLQEFMQVMFATQSFLPHAHTPQMGDKLFAMRRQMLAEASRIVGVVDFSDEVAVGDEVAALASPGQEGDACVSAFSQLQVALERLVHMCGHLAVQAKEDSSRIVKMDGEIKSGRATIDQLREEVRNSVPRKANADMFTQTITVTGNAFSQTEPSSDDSASRRATPPVLSKPPPEMETLSQFLSK